MPKENSRFKMKWINPIASLPTPRLLAAAAALLLMILTIRMLHHRSAPPTSDLLRRCRSQPALGTMCNCDMPRLAPAATHWRPAFALMIDESEDRSVGVYMLVKALLGAGVPGHDIYSVQPASRPRFDGISALHLSSMVSGSAEAQKFVLDLLLRCHPHDYSHVVVLDDYMEVSRDFVPLLQRMALRTAADDNLLAVSMASVNGYEATAVDARQFRRTEQFVTGAWMLSRRMHTDVLEPSWPALVAVDLFSSSDLLHGPWAAAAERLMAEQQLDVIYPEVARAAASANTQEVARPRPAHDYTFNVRLHSGEIVEPVGLGAVGVGALDAAQYVAQLEALVDRATLWPCPQTADPPAAAVVVVPLVVADDSDVEWDVLLENRMGLQSRAAGGRPCGLFRGTVLVRWRDRLVLLVASYSPLATRPALAAVFAAPPECVAKAGQGPGAAAALQAAGAELVTAGEGQPCSVACGARDCVSALLHLANTCDGCGLCVEERVQLWAPARSSQDDVCHRAAFERHLSCSAFPPRSIKRLCACRKP